MSTLDVYQRTDDRWAWRLIADNGQIIATDGGQGYENREDCERIGKAIVRGAYAPPSELSEVVLAPGFIVLDCPDCDSTMLGRPGESIEHADGGARVFHTSYGSGT